MKIRITYQVSKKSYLDIKSKIRNFNKKKAKKEYNYSSDIIKIIKILFNATNKIKLSKI